MLFDRPTKPTLGRCGLTDWTTEHQQPSWCLHNFNAQQTYRCWRESQTNCLEWNGGQRSTAKMRRGRGLNTQELSQSVPGTLGPEHGWHVGSQIGRGTDNHTLYWNHHLCGQAVEIIAFSLKNNPLNCTPAGGEELHTAYKDIEQQGAINFIKTIKAWARAR